MPAPRPSPGASFGVLVGLALVSGFAALVYESVWLRWFRLLFGNTAHAASATLAAFFLGLALGAAFFGRRSARTARPLRTYGIIEAGAALTALWVPLALKLYAPLYGTLYGSLAGSRDLFVAVKFGLAVAAMLPTTILLGGTLPMLVAAFGSGRTLGGDGSRLYAVNTLGATVGAALGALLLPEWIGVVATYAVGLAGTVVAATWALAQAREHEPARAPAAQAPDVSLRADRGPLLVAFASGFCVLATEVLFIHGLGQLYSHSAYSFGAVLLVVLVSLALSAWFVGATARKLDAAALLRTSTLIEAVILLVLPAAILASRGLPPGFVRGVLSLFSLPDYWSSYLYVVLGGLPTFVVAGLVFPLTFRLASKGPAGPRIGGLLAANTVGSILGSVAASFLLIEGLGLWSSLGLLGLVYGAASILVPGAPRKRLVAAGVLAAALLLVLVTPLDPWSLARVTLGEGEKLVALEEGANGVVSVVEREGYRRIKIDDRYEFGDTREHALYERSGHLPLLLHRDPKRVVFIGSATGSVAGAAVLHPVERIELVEIVPEVQHFAETYFAEWNRGVSTDRRAVLVVEDGRNHMRGTRERYDVVVEDLFVPYRPSAAAMYSRDHYRDVRAHLDDGGVFCQWLPVYQLRGETFRIIASTFLDVFPDATMWRCHARAGLAMVGLVGRVGPTPTVEQIEARARALASHGVKDRWITEPRGVWLLYIAPLRFLFQRTVRAPVHSDDHPIFDFVAARDDASAVSDFCFLAWPNLAADLAERADEEDPILPGRPKGLHRAMSALVRANAAVYTTGDRAEMTRWWREWAQAAPPELLGAPDPTFSDVWAR